MLHHRAAAARADVDPGVPRRPARHRHHRHRRPHQRAASDRPRHQDDQACLLRRRRRRDRLRRADQGPRHAARQRHDDRPRGRRLSRPSRHHGPMEVGARDRHQGAHARRRHRRRRHLLRPLRRRRAHQGNGEEDGAEADHLRDGQPGAGDPPGTRLRSSRRRHRRHRPLGLSQPGQQRPRLSLHLPRRPRCAGAHHQRRR